MMFLPNLLEHRILIMFLGLCSMDFFNLKPLKLLLSGEASSLQNSIIILTVFSILGVA